MSGDTAIRLVADAPGRLANFLQALSRLPADPTWALIGGLAVNLRIRQVHRLTNDVDTVTTDQARLVDALLAGDAERLSFGKILVAVDGGEVEVDVMGDTHDEPLPAEAGDRAFALTRRHTIGSAEPLDIELVDPADRTLVLDEATLPTATIPALVALKAIAVPRRQDSAHSRAKVGSDINDLVHLTRGHDLSQLADQIAAIGPEVADHVGAQLITRFTGADLRYTHALLRRLDRSPAAADITEDDLALLGTLGAQLIDRTP